MQTYWHALLQTGIELLVYVGLGVLLMLIGAWLVDLAIPVNFPEEIEKDNRAVAWLSAGIYIGLGFIIKSAIQSFDNTKETGILLYGVIDTLFYSIIGIILFIIAYYLFDIIHRKYKFNEEIAKKNESMGIMLFGIFIGLALIISGVIL